MDEYAHPDLGEGGGGQPEIGLEGATLQRHLAGFLLG